MNLHEFLTMGGYAAYVWPAFGIAAVLMGMQWVLAKQEQKKIYRKIMRGYE